MSNFASEELKTNHEWYFIISLYSLSVLRVSIAERDSVVRIVASEEKPRKAANQNRYYRNIKIHPLKKKKNMVKMCIVWSDR